MRREELEHVIRAAADIAADDDIVILGSQAILGQFPDAPESLLVSREADVYPLHDPDKAELIDAAIGDGSQFFLTFGYYAHGVGPETAKAPAGWQERLVAVRNENTGGATGWCLEAHDLALSKCAAGRERDWDYVYEALRHGLVHADELLARAPSLPVPAEQLAHTVKLLEGNIARVERSQRRSDG